MLGFQEKDWTISFMNSDETNEEHNEILERLILVEGRQ